MRRAIQGTISQLLKTSNNPHSLGRRYATSLRLLWRKSSGKQPAGADSRRESLREPPTPVQDNAQPESAVAGAGDKPLGLDPLNGFSWRDLDSLGQYIANNSALNISDGMLTTPEFDWDHSSSGLEDLTMRPPFDAAWSGHDIIF